jgi:hypothetical protein
MQQRAINLARGKRRGPTLPALLLMVGGGCSGVPVAPPVATSVSITLLESPIEVGQITRATVTTLDQYGAVIDPGPAAYASDNPAVAEISPTTGLIVARAEGATRISATIGGMTGTSTLTVANLPIVINEIDPEGEGDLGWVELHNPTDAVVDLSRWILTDFYIFIGDTLPVGTTIPPRGYLVIDEAAFLFGFGSAGEVHLFNRFGFQVAEYAWQEDPTTSYGRCPSATGPLVTTAAPTRGAANTCP